MVYGSTHLHFRRRASTIGLATRYSARLSNTLMDNHVISFAKVCSTLRRKQAVERTRRFGGSSSEVLWRRTASWPRSHCRAMPCHMAVTETEE